MGTKRDNLKRRVLKTVKWGGAGLTALLFFAWIGTSMKGLGILWPDSAGNRREIRLDGGRLDFVWTRIVVAEWDWSVRPASPFCWWFEIETTPGFRHKIHVPLWCLAVMIGAISSWAWRRGTLTLRRVREGLCAGCGYDRAGLAAGAACPECGAAAGA